MKYLLVKSTFKNGRLIHRRMCHYGLMYDKPESFHGSINQQVENEVSGGGKEIDWNRVYHPDSDTEVRFDVYELGPCVVGD